MSAGNQHTQYAYHRPTPTQVPWQPEYGNTQLQSTNSASLNDMVVHFQNQFDEIDRQRELQLQQEEWSYQAYLHEQELEDQRWRFEEYLIK